MKKRFSLFVLLMTIMFGIAACSAPPGDDDSNSGGDTSSTGGTTSNDSGGSTSTGGTATTSGGSTSTGGVGVSENVIVCDPTFKASTSFETICPSLLNDALPGQQDDCCMFQTLYNPCALAMTAKSQPFSDSVPTLLTSDYDTQREKQTWAAKKFGYANFRSQFWRSQNINPSKGIIISADQIKVSNSDNVDEVFVCMSEFVSATKAAQQNGDSPPSAF